MSKIYNNTIRKKHSELEYKSLRNEILKRIELRQQLIAISLTLAGIFLSVGLTTNLVVLIYPPLAAFLALGWAQNDFRIRDIANYIRENLESSKNNLRYETYVQKMRKESNGLGSWRIVVFSHSGIFIFTQLMAVGIELSKTTSLNYPPIKWILLSIDLVAFLIVIWIAVQSKR
jgi:hypothetical protein